MTYTSPFTGNVIVPTDVSYQSIELTANLELVWPVFDDGNQTVAARIMDVDPTVGSLSLTMPGANQVSVGQDALINNIGSFAFDVLDNDGGTICTVQSGQSQYIYITDNTTAAGVWGIIGFGATTTTANASILAGAGLQATSATLNQTHPVTGFSTGYTFTSSDRAQTKIWDFGAGSATLPAAATIGNNWFCLLKNDGTGTLTVNCSGIDTIDGSSSKIFGPSESAFIVCTGSKYVTVGYGQSTNFVFNALVKSVTGGSYTITPSEASNTIQQYIGNLASNVTATYPPAVNLYVISNQVTDNGYTLEITTGIVGAASVIIPPGQQVTLICDGTNFLNANTTQAGATNILLLNGTVSAPSLSFSAEITTGIYRSGVGLMDIAILGNNVGQFSAGGLTITGSGTFSAGIEGGTFP